MLSVTSRTISPVKKTHWPSDDLPRILCKFTASERDVAMKIVTVVDEHCVRRRRSALAFRRHALANPSKHGRATKVRCRCHVFGHWRGAVRAGATEAGPSWVTPRVGAMYSITGAGPSWVTPGAGAMYSDTGAGAVQVGVGDA